MKRNSLFLFALAVVVSLILVGVVVLAQSSASFDLSWHTMDSGGGNASSASYRVDGTIGQADAGSVSSASYRMTGGFWQNFPSAEDGQRIYLPSILLSNAGEPY